MACVGAGEGEIKEDSGPGSDCLGAVRSLPRREKQEGCRLGMWEVEGKADFPSTQDDGCCSRGWRPMLVLWNVRGWAVLILEFQNY